MTLHSIKLKNFRNLDGEYSLSNGINLIIAPNGAGKTNFLEAVNFLSTGQSFRTSHESFVIKNNKTSSSHLNFTRIEGVFSGLLGNESTREIILEKTTNSNGNGCKKTLKIDGKRSPLSKFLKDFYTVSFSPNTINLVVDSPAIRRKDMNDFLNVFDREYFEEISKYRQIIRNRNKILEKIQERQAKKSELNFWNEKLASLGSKIIYKRVKLFEVINPIISKVAPDLFNLKIKNLSIEYISKFIDTKNLDGIHQAFAQKIQQNIDKEIQAGTTLYGPQREDFVLKLNGDDLSEFGSRGQQRLFAFLYKIAEWNLLTKEKGVIPMLLLDDLFSELDKKVRENTRHFLKNIEGQVILTALARNEIDGKFLEDMNEIKL